MIRLEAKRLFGWNLSVRTVHVYPDEKLPLVTVMNEVARKKKPDGDTLFLVSVNSSGRLIRRIRRERPGRHSVVIVCNAGPDVPDTESLARIPIARWKVGQDDQCGHCKETNLIGIDQRTYERIPEIKWNRIAIAVKQAEEHRPFWEAVDRTNAVRLHTTEDYAKYKTTIGNSAVVSAVSFVFACDQRACWLRKPEYRVP
jgi:hypothetical protein